MRLFSLPVALALLLSPVLGVAQQSADTGLQLGAEPAERVRVVSLTLGTHVLGDKRIAVPSTLFRPVDPIHVSIETMAPDMPVQTATLGVRWTYGEGDDEQLVKSDVAELQVSGEGRTVFSITKPTDWPSGTYRVEVFLDGAQAGSATFHVR